MRSSNLTRIAVVVVSIVLGDDSDDGVDSSLVILTSWFGMD